MQEVWRTIPAFPKYRVSNMGHVQFIKTGRILNPSKNQQGHLKVNLVKNGETYTRNINHLVAKAFLETPERDDFISLIHLDGDKSNCRADNLQWRPRYFAIKYHLQFQSKLYRSSKIPIADVKSGEEYPSIQAAVVRHGLLFNDVLISTHERTYVWPTYQQFRTLSV